MELKDRIKARLDALGLNAFEAARNAGLERAFINDVIAGRKSKIHPRNYAKLALVLGCSAEYLRGEVQEPTPVKALGGAGALSTENAAFGLNILGTVEAGAFRRREKSRNELAPIAYDPRFPGARQIAFEVRRQNIKSQVFASGRSFIGAVDFDDYVKGWGALRNGEHVIVETRSAGDPELAETTCAEVFFVAGEMLLVSRFAQGARDKAALTSQQTILAVACRYVQLS